MVVIDEATDSEVMIVAVMEDVVSEIVVNVASVAMTIGVAMISAVTIGAAMALVADSGGMMTVAVTIDAAMDLVAAFDGMMSVAGMIDEVFNDRAMTAEQGTAVVVHPLATTVEAVVALGRVDRLSVSRIDQAKVVHLKVEFPANARLAKAVGHRRGLESQAVDEPRAADFQMAIAQAATRAIGQVVHRVASRAVAAAVANVGILAASSPS